MPFPYWLQRVTLDDAPIDGDLADLDALDHLQDGGGLGSGLDALDGILDLGGSPHLRVGPQKVRNGLDKRRIFGGTLFGGLGVTLLVLLLIGFQKLLRRLTHGLVVLAVDDGLKERGDGVQSSSRHIFVSFLVFKSSRSLFSVFIVP